MNIDNDYDNDGNNIVPCPICLSIHCPSKEDGKCPGEDMFELEGEIRMLLGEYEETGDNSRIANVLETVERLLTSRDTYWKERVRKEVEESLTVVKLRIVYDRRQNTPAEETVQDIYDSIELKLTPITNEDNLK